MNRNFNPRPRSEYIDAAAPTNYTETRTLNAHDLRALCIRRDWYTRGTCEAYEHLLCDLTEGNITTERLAEIAADIMDHSELPEDYRIPDIMFEVARICTVYFR